MQNPLVYAPDEWNLKTFVNTSLMHRSFPSPCLSMQNKNRSWNQYVKMRPSPVHKVSSPAIHPPKISEWLFFLALNNRVKWKGNSYGKQTLFDLKIKPKHLIKTSTLHCWMNFTEGTWSAWLTGNIQAAPCRTVPMVIPSTDTNPLHQEKVFPGLWPISASSFLNLFFLNHFHVTHFALLPVSPFAPGSFRGKTHRPWWITMRVYPAWASFISIFSGDHQ